MIHVNILLPLVGDVLRVSCDEDSLSDHLMERIEQALQTNLYFDRHSWLCHIEKRHILTHNQTLRDNGLTDECNLILI